MNQTDKNACISGCTEDYGADACQIMGFMLVVITHLMSLLILWIPIK